MRKERDVRIIESIQGSHLYFQAAAVTAPLHTPVRKPSDSWPVLTAP